MGSALGEVTAFASLNGVRELSTARDATARRSAMYSKCFCSRAFNCWTKARSDCSVSPLPCAQKTAHQLHTNVLASAYQIYMHAHLFACVLARVCKIMSRPSRSNSSPHRQPIPTHTSSVHSHPSRSLAIWAQMQQGSVRTSASRTSGVASEASNDTSTPPGPTAPEASPPDEPGMRISGDARFETHVPPTL